MRAIASPDQSGLTELERARRKEFVDGTLPSERLVLLLDRLSKCDAPGLDRFDTWVKSQPLNRETGILVWAREYREYESAGSKRHRP